MNKVSILFVCTENICRSTMAQAVMQRKLKEEGLHKFVKVSSAGTHASQPGHKPDSRAVKVAGRAGIKMRRIKANKISPVDFKNFDYILAMDKNNLQDLLSISPDDYVHKVGLIMQYAQQSEVAEAIEVPDPYFGNDAGFENVFELLNVACVGVIKTLRTGELKGR